MRTLAGLFAVSALAAVTVSTAHFDNSRCNWNSSETVLSPANFKLRTFGRLGYFTVDGAVRAQPLVIPAVSISGVPHDLLIVATMNNSVYAFDANSPGSVALWHFSNGTPRTTWPGSGTGDNVAYSGGQLGCMATPVVDVPNSTVYALCANSTPAWTLYQLSLTTGSTLLSTTISGQFAGTGCAGDTITGGKVQFSATQELARAALTLANSKVYIAFGSFNDKSPWHGWVMSYDTTALSQQAVYMTTPNGCAGGIWQSGGGLAVDGSGNLYSTTGNGDYDGTANYANSIIKLSSALAISDWWTPSNYAAMSAADQDVASGRAMLIPGTTLVAAGGKDYRVYSTDSTCMGHLQGGATSCAGAQVFFTNASGPAGDLGIYGGLFGNGVGYWPNTGATYAFTLSGSSFNTSATVSPLQFAYPGAQMSGSSNGASNGIVWAVTSAGMNPEINPAVGTLRAMNPATLADYWTSDQTGFDALGTMSKFCAPTVANGKVYVGTLDNRVVAYGVISPQGGMMMH